MQIEQIEIKNYRLFREVKLTKLPPMVVVVGANGTGKSTLFDLFSFIKEALADNVAVAAARRGGLDELTSRGEKAAIDITIKFRESGGRLASYILKVTEDKGRAVVHREILRYRRGSGSGRPWHFVDFSHGKGKAITNESVYGDKNAIAERAEYELDDPSILAIKGLGQFREFRVVSEFRNLIENWHVSNFHIANARPSAEAGYAEHLSSLGDNVAQVAQYMFESHNEQFHRVLDAMRTRVPGVEHVEAKSTLDGRLVLCFKEGSFEDPFIARYVSDGTIKMFAYLVMLYDPKPHPLLAVEEPENQLYPSLLGVLIEEFRDYARRGGQVFISTHSPDFLSAARLDEIFWLQKKDGFSKIRRASDIELLKGLAEEGDDPGTLWRHRLFEGADP